MKNSSQLRAYVCRLAALVLLAGGLLTVPAAAQGAASSDAITVGVIMPITGREGKPGQYQKEGIELAIKQINDAGGIMVKDKGKKLLVKEVFYDDGSDSAKSASLAERAMSTDQLPIHPLRLCREVRDFLERDAILCVDGQEILNFGRQSIPTYFPGHRLNSGPFGTMGVGLPFGLGAKVARPDSQVLVLHGDGSMGLNAMELDTAVRHRINVLTVVSNNGGWTASDRPKAGRDLGYTRFDLVAKALGCHGEQVERPDDILPALRRGMAAVASGRPALVNVVTDWTARATTVAFSKSMT